jgi:hypothetical protein
MRYNGFNHWFVAHGQPGHGFGFVAVHVFSLSYFAYHGA